MDSHYVHLICFLLKEMHTNVVFISFNYIVLCRCIKAVLQEKCMLNLNHIYHDLTYYLGTLSHRDN